MTITTLNNRSVKLPARWAVLALFLLPPLAAWQSPDGITFVSSTSVSDTAVKRAQYVIQVMTSHSPGIREVMRARGFKVEIIAKDQVISDLPDYAGLKGKKTFDGRSFDTGTRGVGGKNRCSIGEENLLCLRNQSYRQEDIFVHEFSHSIMANLGVELSGAIRRAYANAVSKGLYPSGIYMMANAQEYWAEGTQTWFEVTVRSDVNGGFNTRAKLKAHDPDLAAILGQVYGSAQLQRVPGCVY
jgi:hypothetical protein